MVEGAERSQPVFDRMVEKTGCANATDKIACLRVAGFNDIMTSVNEEGFCKFSYTFLQFSCFLFANAVLCSVLWPSALASPWTLRPDGKHLKDSPHRLATAGKMASVPLITGDMRDEGTLFSLFAQLETTTDGEFKLYFQSIWWPNATDADMASLMELYPSDDSEGSPFDTDDLNAITPNFKRLASLMGDFSLQAQRRNLLAHYNTSAVWNYVTDITIPTAGLVSDVSDVESDLGLGLLSDLTTSVADNLTRIPVLGSFHLFDALFYLFGGPPSTLSKNTEGYQATTIPFINTLNPNNHGLSLPEWPSYTRDGRDVQLQGERAQGGCGRLAH
jgi:acetylcholinesterase